MKKPPRWVSCRRSPVWMMRKRRLYGDRASGDGLDTNGTMKMSGGTVIVNGPVSSGNGALDYDNGFPVTGGTLIAACSSGIALAPDSSSTQYFVSINCDSVLAVNTVVSMT